MDNETAQHVGPSVHSVMGESRTPTHQEDVQEDLTFFSFD